MENKRVTRAATKTLQQMAEICRPHRFDCFFEANPTTKNVRVTRLLSKALKMANVNLLTEKKLPQKIRRRRQTCAPEQPKPKKSHLFRSHRNDLDGHTWCICRKPSFGQMIQCDGPSCTIQWFHVPCMKIRKIPKGSWHCPDCAPAK